MRDLYRRRMPVSDASALAFLSVYLPGAVLLGALVSHIAHGFAVVRLCNASSTCLRSVHSSVFPCAASSVWRRTSPIDALHHVCVLMTLHVTDLFMQDEHDLCMPRSWLIATESVSREQLT